MRILHTMLREAIQIVQSNFIKMFQVCAYYAPVKTQNTKYTLAFLGYEDGESAAEIELTYNWGVDKYEQGTAYGHIAIGVDDIYAICEAVRAKWW